MTRKNDKRNNRRNSRQRNNNPELPPFAQMLFGAIVGKGAGMIADALKEKAEEKTEDKPHTGIRQSGNLLESSCIINGDGSATEIPIPDGFQIFISEDGKPMIRKKIEGDEKKAPDIHAEGISNQDVTNINNGKATLSKLRIPADGSAVEYPIPDNLQFFFAEDGKLMVRQKIEGDENPTDAGEGKPITYDDICKKLFLDMIAYKKSVKCTTPAQGKRCDAFNKLQNIAKYLNHGWKPNFTDGTQNWFITEEYFGKYKAKFTYSGNYGIVFFKSKCLVNEAIRLMGEESLNDLFSTDW